MEGDYRSMKRITLICLTLLLAASLAAGCRKAGRDTETTASAQTDTPSADAASSEAAGAEGTENETTASEPASTEAAETFLIRINTEGPGQIAFTDDGTEPKADPDHPAQSAGLHAARGTGIRLAAFPDQGCVFLKWTKNGKDYAEDAQISFSAEEDVEFIAVFAPESADQEEGKDKDQDHKDKGSKDKDKDNETDGAVSSFKTLGELFAAAPSQGTAFEDRTYVYAFKLKGLYYRALADVPKDVASALWALNYDDDQYESKAEALLSSVKIREIQNLSAEIPSKEELEALKGRTGRQLIKDGWTFRGYDLKTMKFKAWHGVFAYTVTFDGKLNSIDELGEYEEVYPLKVKKVSYKGFGDITNLD